MFLRTRETGDVQNRTALNLSGICTQLTTIRPTTFADFAFSAADRLLFHFVAWGGAGL